ncbi:MAG TPA: flagellar hook-basal body complex protein [Candidatus Wallbacteria bacterium]|nr:flagellar hook-basal body complex protein [Candidatus Wallbacteria bacterium]
MMRTFNSSVLGLQSFQTQMDVISNNIANVNNTGYKKTRVLFEDVLSQTMSNGQAPSGGYGGLNPMQIGLGSKIGAIDSVFTQGAMQGTGRDIDMAIQGEGFFITTDGTGSKYFTRSGAFDLDSQLNLVHSVSATKGMGWLAAEDPVSKNLVIDTSKPVTALNFTNYQKIAAASTTSVEFASNLKMSATERSLPDERVLSFTDDQGDAHNLTVRFTKVDKNNWNWTAYDDNNVQVKTGALKFDDNGKITASTGGQIVYDPDGTGGTPASLKLQTGNSANITGAELKTPSDSTKSGVHSITSSKISATAASVSGDKTGVYRYTTLGELGVTDTTGFKIAVDGSTTGVEISGLSVNSTVSDLISAINTQSGGAIAEMSGDKVVVKRAIAGSAYKVELMAPASDIGNKVFGTALQTTAGTNQSFRVTDIFTPADGSASMTFIYNNAQNGLVIGKGLINGVEQNVGEIILSASDIQPGTATITTRAKHNAGEVRVEVPQAESYAANFNLISGGTQTSGISTSLLMGTTHNVSMNIYDSTGYNHKVNMNFEKTENNKWVYTAVLDSADPMVAEYFKTHPIKGSQPTSSELREASASIMGASNSGTLVFDKAGKIDAASTAAANGVTAPQLSKPISFTPANANKVEFNPDFNLVTQYDSEFSTGVKNSNGYEMGKLNGFLVDESGIIKGSYSNGQKLAIAQIGLAKFINNGGLVKHSDNLYSEASNSGQAQIGTTNSSGRGSILSQNLEMSNVDLAHEFTEMIISQRGFQANAKTINTADQMLQEIITLKR